MVLKPGFKWHRCSILREANDAYYLHGAYIKASWKHQMTLLHGTASTPAPTLSEVCRENLIAIAKSYGRAEGLSLSQVSKRCYGNAKFFNEFVKGKQSISVAKLDRMLKWFNENWPENARPPIVRPMFMRVQKNGRKILDSPF